MSIKVDHIPEYAGPPPPVKKSNVIINKQSFIF